MYHVLYITLESDEVTLNVDPGYATFEDAERRARFLNSLDQRHNAVVYTEA